MSLSALQQGFLQANRQLFKILPNKTITIRGQVISGHMNTQSTNLQRDDGGYTNIEQRYFYTDEVLMPFMPDLNEQVKIDGLYYQVKEISHQSPNIKLLLIRDLYDHS